jgi:hypothetical protein
LNVGQEGVAAKGVGVPQGKAALRELVELIGGESVELVVKVALAEGSPLIGVGVKDTPEEEDTENQQQYNRQQIP